MSTPIDYILVRARDVVPQQWLNGGGKTRTLHATPNGSDWNFRISLACIEKNGPFSTMSGVERCFAVVEGAGVRLGFPKGEAVLSLGDPPIRFDGSDAPDCHLVDGPTQDLNLMIRRGVGAMRLAAPGRSWQEQFTERGFFATAAGRFCIGTINDAGHRSDENSITLEPFSLLWNVGDGECWFEPDDGRNAGFWLGYSS